LLDDGSIAIKITLDCLRHVEARTSTWNFVNPKQTARARAGRSQNKRSDSIDTSATEPTSYRGDAYLHMLRLKEQQINYIIDLRIYGIRDKL